MGVDRTSPPANQSWIELAWFWMPEDRQRSRYSLRWFYNIQKTWLKRQLKRDRPSYAVPCPRASKAFTFDGCLSCSFTRNISCGRSFISRAMKTSGSCAMRVL